MPLHPSPAKISARADQWQDVAKVYPQVAHIPDTDQMTAAWAAHSGQSKTQLLALMADEKFLDDCDAELSKSVATGEALEPLASYAMHKLLTVVLKAAERGELDPVEAAELTKPFQKILDAADRRRAAQQDDRPQLIINIGDLPGIAEALQRGPVNPLAHMTIDMVEVDAPEPQFGSSEVSVVPGDPDAPRIVFDGGKQ
jgi:hypothetical protein